MTTKPGTKTPKKTRCRKVASKEPKPLTNDEYATAHQLVDQARYSNDRVLNAARDLQQARKDLLNAEAYLRGCLVEMDEARAENQRIHAELAPLIHRLPA